MAQNLSPAVKVGVTVTGIGLAGAALYLLLPYMVAVAGGLITLGAYAILMVIIASVLMSKEFYKAVEVWTDQAGAFLKNQGIMINPIEVMKSQLSRIRAKIGELDDMVASVRGAETALRKQASEFEREVNQLTGQARAAKSAGNLNQAGTYMSMAKGSADRLKRFVEKADVLAKYVAALVARRNEAMSVVDLRTHEVRGLEHEYKAMKSAAKAAKGAEGLLGGGEYELWTEALNITNTQLSQMEGTLTHYLDTSAGVIQDAEYRTSADAQAGLEALERFETTGQLNFDTRAFTEITEEVATSKTAGRRVTV